MTREIKFRVWYRGHMYDRVNLRIEPDYTAVEIVKGRGGNVHTDTTKAKLMQFTGLHDKNGKEIYEGDVLKTFVRRDNYTHHTNENHKGFYLNCEVLDIRGNIRFQKEAIKELAQPIGRERETQRVDYDRNLFDPYSCKRIVRDNDGKYVVDENDPCKNYKWYLDIEVIGDIYSNPDLL